MKRVSLSITAILALSTLFLSCSGSKEEIRQEKPEIATPELTVPPPPRVFRYEDRYFVRNASIDNPANIEDPLQAIRVIQLKPGTNAVLVISTFDKANEEGKDVAIETWLGIEMPSFAPGTYDIAKAANMSFYRFYLGQSGIRFDGRKYSGSITIEDDAEGYLTGHIDALVVGETKSFDTPSREFKTAFTGSFRIKDVQLEDTIMKGKR